MGCVKMSSHQLTVETVLGENGQATSLIQCRGPQRPLSNDHPTPDAETCALPFRHDEIQNFGLATALSGGVARNLASMADTPTSPDSFSMTRGQVL